MGTEAMRALDAAGLAALVDARRAEGWRVIAPVVRDGVVVPAPVDGIDELPEGVGDDQGPGWYRRTERGDRCRFGFASTAPGWKRWLHPADEVVAEVELAADPDGGPAWTARHLPTDAPPTLLLGVRACDVAAIGVLDRVVGATGAADPAYLARRASTVVVAVDCAVPASTCFCASMGTGPAASAGYDLALSEVLDPESGDPTYLVRTGSKRGELLLAGLVSRDPTDDEQRRAVASVDAAARAQVRAVDREAARVGLPAARGVARWDDVAERCLACTNCTLVCPTCFCSAFEERTDAAGTTASRRRRWDSCFSVAFSEMHGGSVRRSTSARYRQWLTHKLATWWDQFGEAGCVGCGRCITWCPVGIDITAEVAAVLADELVATPVRYPHGPASPVPQRERDSDA